MKKETERAVAGTMLQKIDLEGLGEKKKELKGK